MAQASSNEVANGTGAFVRSELNQRLAALFTNHSGATDTSIATKYAYQFWADTTANQLKIRSGSNSWIPLRSLTGGVIAPAGSISAPSLTFGADGPDYGFYRSGTGEVSFVTQVDGADHQLFRIGKDMTDSVIPDAGISLSWGYMGNLLTTTNTTNSGLLIKEDGSIIVARNGATCLTLNRVGTEATGTGGRYGKIVGFSTNGTAAGKISIISATDVEFVDSSDRRLKDNITDMPEAKSRVNSIEMKKFRMISADTYEEGFIAQQLKEVMPSAVVGTENDLDENGNIEYMGVAKALLIPLLTKGLQEAYSEIAALTARIEALEAG